jgi:hypothetical protein
MALAGFIIGILPSKYLACQRPRYRGITVSIKGGNDEPR